MLNTICHLLCMCRALAWHAAGIEMILSVGDASGGFCGHKECGALEPKHEETAG